MNARPEGMSRRRWRGIRAAAAKDGAILLPGEPDGALSHDRKLLHAADDARFAEAIERCKASEARTREWLDARAEFWGGER